jgi:hypothetical protein
VGEVVLAERAEYGDTVESFVAALLSWFFLGFLLLGLGLRIIHLIWRAALYLLLHEI